MNSFSTNRPHCVRHASQLSVHTLTNRQSYYCSVIIPDLITNDLRASVINPGGTAVEYAYIYSAPNCFFKDGTTLNQYFELLPMVLLNIHHL